jgi:cardiolipin synthase
MVILLIQGLFFKALIVFVAAGLSDALDGFLARILHQQTVVGAYLDPIADKALLASAFVTLSVLHIIPGWLTVLVISRDFIILLGILVLSIMSVSVQIRPVFISKITTALQLITVLLALTARCLPGAFDARWLLPLYWLTALFTVISGLTYIARGLTLLNNDVKK